MKASEIQVGVEYAISSTNDAFPHNASRARVLEVGAPFDRNGRYRHTPGTGTKVVYLDDRGNVRQRQVSNYGPQHGETVDYGEVVMNRAVRMLWSEYAAESKRRRKAAREAEQSKRDSKAAAVAKHAELLRLLDAKGIRRPQMMREWYVDGDAVLRKPYWDGDTASTPYDAEKHSTTVDVGWLVEILGGLPDPDAEPLDDDDLDDVELALASDEEI